MIRSGCASDKNTQTITIVCVFIAIALQFLRHLWYYYVLILMKHHQPLSNICLMLRSSNRSDNISLGLVTQAKSSSLILHVARQGSSLHLLCVTGNILVAWCNMVGKELTCRGVPVYWESLRLSQTAHITNDHFVIFIQTDKCNWFQYFIKLS